MDLCSGGKAERNRAGHTVRTKVYSGYRHEIHNYAAIKDEVEAGIIEFMDEIAKG